MGRRQGSTRHKDLLPQHVHILPLSTHAPLKCRSGPTEQSSSLSRFPGAATGAEHLRHDGTWGWGWRKNRCLPHTNLSPSQFLLLHAPVGKSCSCPFPTFIQEEPQQRSAQAERLWKSKARSSWDSGAGARGGVVDGGIWKRQPKFCSKMQWFSSALGMMLPPSAPQSLSGRASEGAKHQMVQNLRAASSSRLPQTNPETPTSPLCPSIHSPPSPALGTHKF